jgi:hypothetical protein
MQVLVTRFHTLIDMSHDPEYSLWSVSESITEQTPDVCPLSIAMGIRALSSLLMLVVSSIDLFALLLMWWSAE